MKLRTGLLYCFLMSLTIASCSSDVCEKISCSNNGVCVDGVCACPYGFEGEFCEETWYNKFTGGWSVTETRNTDTAIIVYDINVVNYRTLDTLFLLGFADSVDTVFAVREKYNTFTIKERVVDSAFAVQSGNGMIDDTRQTVTGLYTFKKGDQITTVNFTWAR